MKKLLFFILILFVPFIVYAEELKMEWQKSWGGTDITDIYQVMQTQDGKFVLCGYTSSVDANGQQNKVSNDAIIVKFDENGNVIWENVWGGNNYDRFEKLIITPEDEYILLATSLSTDIDGLSNKGGQDVSIVKYDKDGNLVWQKSWGGNFGDSFTDFFQTQDGGFIICGLFQSTNIENLSNKGAVDAVIVKYDKNGNLIWQKSWGGNGSDTFSNLFQTYDGDFILYGLSNSTDIEGLHNNGEIDAIVVKYDKNGNLVWQKNWGGNSSEVFRKIYQTENDEFIAFGISNSTDIDDLTNKGDYDLIVVKFDNEGNILSQNMFGGNKEDNFIDISKTFDDEFLAYGYSSSTDIEGLSNKGESDAIIVKYDKDGNLLWQKNWGGNADDRLYSLNQTDGGNVIMNFSSTSTDIEDLPNKGLVDVVIAKYNNIGDLIWQKSWGGNNIEVFGNLFQTFDGGFITYGISNSTDIEGIINADSNNFNIVLVKYSIEYELENIVSENGASTVEQQGKYGMITSTPIEGYEVDEIVVKDKDGNVLDVKVEKLEDGKYSFDLYTDVSIEVLFKEVLVNPKTGVVSYVGAIISIIFISISTLLVLMFRSKSYRL